MKRKIITLIMCICFACLCTSCENTKNEEKVINMFCETHYINTTESWSINSHNGYKAIYTFKDYDASTDTYTIIIQFKKLTY